MKSGSRRVFRYSSTHEKVLPDGSIRRRMELHRAHMPAPKGFGRPRTHSLHEIIDAIFYLLKSGCQWRLLPHDFPRWPTVYHYFRKWRRDGTWERINRALRERLRVRLKRDPKPSAGVVDSQSVKSTAVGGEERVVTTEPRRSRAASATSWWTPRASCSLGEDPQRQGGGPRRDQGATVESGRAIPPPLSPVGGRWLARRGQGRGLGREDPGLERGPGGASEKARPRRGVDGVGQGVGQRGGGRELAETIASQRLTGVAEE